MTDDLCISHELERDDESCRCHKLETDESRVREREISTRLMRRVDITNSRHTSVL